MRVKLLLQKNLERERLDGRSSTHSDSFQPECVNNNVRLGRSVDEVRSAGRNNERFGQAEVLSQLFCHAGHRHAAYLRLFFWASSQERSIR